MAMTQFVSDITFEPVATTASGDTAAKIGAFHLCRVAAVAKAAPNDLVVAPSRRRLHSDQPTEPLASQVLSFSVDAAAAFGFADGQVIALYANNVSAITATQPTNRPRLPFWYLGQHGEPTERLSCEIDFLGHP
jgi:hypothetical protein